MNRFPQFDFPRIFPAIDLRGARCVRLVRGRRDAEIHYGDDAVVTARRWHEAGAECLHVIDLGAAFGETDSTEVILEIASTVGLPVQSGGGIRDEEKVARLLEGGVARVILGTRALRDPAFLARVIATYGDDRVVVALDCEGERIKVSGWEEESALDLDGGVALARDGGASHLLVTATERDGTLSGPRLSLYERLLAEDGLRIVVAGGIGELEHVRAVLELPHRTLEGVVVGRALYEGAVKLEDAIALTRSLRSTRTEGKNDGRTA